MEESTMRAKVEPLTPEELDTLFTLLFDQGDCGPNEATKWLCWACSSKLLNFDPRRCLATLDVQQKEVDRLKADHHTLGHWPDCPICLNYFRQDEDHCAENARLEEQIRSLTVERDQANKKVESLFALLEVSPLTPFAVTIESLRAENERLKAEIQELHYPQFITELRQQSDKQRKALEVIARNGCEYGVYLGDAAPRDCLTSKDGVVCNICTAREAISSLSEGNE